MNFERNFERKYIYYYQHLALLDGAPCGRLVELLNILLMIPRFARGDKNLKRYVNINIDKYNQKLIAHSNYLHLNLKYSLYHHTNSPSIFPHLLDQNNYVYYPVMNH